MQAQCHLPVVHWTPEKVLACRQGRHVLGVTAGGGRGAKGKQWLQCFNFYGFSTLDTCMFSSYLTSVVMLFVNFCAGYFLFAISDCHCWPASIDEEYCPRLPWQGVAGRSVSIPHVPDRKNRKMSLWDNLVSSCLFADLRSKSVLTLVPGVPR